MALTAKLGEDVAVGPFTFVGDNTVIGDRTVLHANVFIGPDTQSVVGLIHLAQSELEQTSRQTRPLFLFWNAGDWWKTIELSRRQRSTDEHERRWTVRVLRPPAELLEENSLGSIDVPARKLVQSTG